MKYLALLLPLVLTEQVSFSTESTKFPEDRETHQVNSTCIFTPASDSTSGLIVGADVLLPGGHKSGYGVHITFDGTIGEVGIFDTIEEKYKEADVLNCGSSAILSPGFVNAHEHPGYSYKYLIEKPEPEFEHRDDWRKVVNENGKRLTPDRYEYKADSKKWIKSLLIAVELRHLLSGTTAIAGNGGVPGVIKNIRRKKQWSELSNYVINPYEHQAYVKTFPIEGKAYNKMKNVCVKRPKRAIQSYDYKNREFKDDKRSVKMAYVPHIGEGKASNCLAKLELKHYLKHVEKQRENSHNEKLRNRRYSLVHGIAAQVSNDQGHNDYDKMRRLGITLIWSPRSNLALYGETIDIKSALNKNNEVRIALSTDWSPTGSFSMKEAFKCAKEFSSKLSNELLWQMATSNAAYALGLDDELGAIKPGFWADLVLVKSSGNNDRYDDVLTASHKDIIATWINGKVRLLSKDLSESLSKDICVKIIEEGPKICGVFKDFGLKPNEFTRHINNKKFQNVPLIGGERQTGTDILHTNAIIKR